MKRLEESWPEGPLESLDGTRDKEKHEAYSRPPTSQEAVLREIRQAIMTRRLKPGQWIRQLDVAKRLNVSSVPVREALNTLAAEGQVVHKRHRGYKVVELSREQLEEIYLARRLLEDEVTRQAVPRVDAELARLLEDAVDRMERLASLDDVVSYTEANRNFHLLLFERSGLPRIVGMIEVLWQNSEVYRGLIADLTWYEWAQEDHRKILRACKARDVDGAIAAQEEHRKNALIRIIDHLKEQAV
ncbi:MAG: GntR family transcriptional regulator [Actinomycetota bacterium]|nr:GntR family transcriptional regulator [Actinomycetota bacterium]